MKILMADVAVIGAGTAGLAAFRAARTHGKLALLIEGGTYGTTCARVGCMPSKLLIAAAEAAHAAREAGAFGVQAGPVRVDGRTVMRRVQAERDRFVGFVLDKVEDIPPAARLRGHARFVSPGSLRIDGHTEVRATSIVIATGSRPAVPALLQGLGDRLATSDQIFDWETLPESVAVLGTGVIGLELGQALHRLGVRVALFGRSRNLAQLRDPKVLETARRILGAELDLRLETELLEARRDGDGVLLRWRDAGGERSERFARVLAATGRRPNVDDLGLEHSGLALDQHGVPLFDRETMRCGDSAVFIAGDASDERPLLHEAADGGRIAGDNAGRFPDVRAGLRHAPLAIAFTDPQIATVGQAFSNLPAGGYAAGDVSFDDQGRSRVMLQNRGVLRVYAGHGNQRFLGAEMIAPRAEHLAHLLAWACQNRMTLPRMLEMPYYHPVVEEGLRSALRDARENLMHGVPEIEHCTDCTPGV